MIVLTQAQRDELAELNRTSPFPGRRLLPVPTKDNRWVLREEVLADDFWAHWRSLLSKAQKATVTKNDLMDSRMANGKFDSNHPFHLKMKAERERLESNS